MSVDKINKVKEKLKIFLETVPEVIFAYLHGSLAEGLPFRDIDVAIYVNEGIVSQEKALDYGIRLSIEAEIATKLSPLDIKVINYAPNGFKYHATKGILLFSKDDELRCDFLEKLWNKYLDLQPTRKALLLDILTL